MSDVVELNETCSCGSAFGGRADGPVALGFLRMRHGDWLAEHKPCTVARERKAHPEVAMTPSMVYPMLRQALPQLLEDPKVVRIMAEAVLRFRSSELAELFAPVAFGASSSSSSSPSSHDHVHVDVGPASLSKTRLMKMLGITDT